MSAPTDTTPTAQTSADGERRRSSGGLFNNILAQKRSPDNAAYSARRTSIEEQGPPKGVLGKMWDRYVPRIYSVFDHLANIQYSAVKGVGPEQK